MTWRTRTLVFGLGGFFVALAVYTYALYRQQPGVTWPPVPGLGALFPEGAISALIFGVLALMSRFCRRLFMNEKINGVRPRDAGTAPFFFELGDINEDGTLKP